MALGNLFRRVAQGLGKTASALGGGLRGLLGRRVDQDFLDELEAILLRADVGIDATERILDRVRSAYADREATDDLVDFVKGELRALLDQEDAELRFQPSGPTVVMIAGVNGSGKTTSIAKLATWLRAQEKSVVLGAGDTFRAAAIEQLQTWGERIGADVVKGKHGSDPSSVAHDAVQAGVARNADVVLVDTAGRLHTQPHLMRELEKIHRVIGKVMPGAPHEVLLVLDSTNGQNAIQQAKNFTNVVHCTGLILAKLDGTAKGGFVVQIRDELGLPVKFVGVGEQPDDIAPFDAGAFVDGLFRTD